MQSTTTRFSFLQKLVLAEINFWRLIIFKPKWLSTFFSFLRRIFYSFIMIPNGPPLLTWGLCATAIRTEYKSASPCAQLPDRKPGIENWSWTATNWGTEFGKSIQLNSQIRKQQMETFFSKRNIMGKNNASWEEEWRGKEEDIAYFFLLFATVVLPWWKAFCARENDASSAAAAALQGPWLQELGMQHEMLLSQK